jgi:hypothetical protein
VSSEPSVARTIFLYISSPPPGEHASHDAVARAARRGTSPDDRGRIASFRVALSEALSEGWLSATARRFDGPQMLENARVQSDCSEAAISVLFARSGRRTRLG